MTIQKLDLLTRKDIARLLGPHVSAAMVKRCERKWGLDKARVKLKTREAMFCSEKVFAIFRLAGVLN